jgi:hypothetical protein
MAAGLAAGVLWIVASLSTITIGNGVWAAGVSGGSAVCSYQSGAKPAPALDIKTSGAGRLRLLPGAANSIGFGGGSVERYWFPLWPFPLVCLAGASVLALRQSAHDARMARGKAPAGGDCPNCGYPIKDLARQWREACPECGAPVPGAQFASVMHAIAGHRVLVLDPQARGETAARSDHDVDAPGHA